MLAYFDKEGNTLHHEEWVFKSQDRDYSTIQCDFLDDGDQIVLTLWLGVDCDMSLLARLKKLFNYNYIFSTTVFSYKSGEFLDRKTYSTLEEAKKGHQKMVSKWSVRDKECEVLVGLNKL